jgi:hypothetical protein
MSLHTVLYGRALSGDATPSPLQFRSAMPCLSLPYPLFGVYRVHGVLYVVLSFAALCRLGGRHRTF